MRKILPLMTAIILLASGVGAFDITYDSNYILKNKETSVVISEPIIKETGQHVSVELENKTSYLLIAGKPVLPVITRVFTFPFGCKIRNVDVTFSEIKEIVLSKEVQPGPKSVPLTSEIRMINEPLKDANVYKSAELYPSSSYFYTTGVGIDGERHVVYLSVRCYPVRYSPRQNKIFYSENIDINITYEEPINPIVFPDEYDLVIVAPRKFQLSLQPLIVHKNMHGVKTRLKTTESIYREDFFGKYDARGRDNPEKIKYFIKYAIENWGINYVLFVGGHQNQRFNWHVPVRYSRLHDRSLWNDSYISDLYYADIYRYNKTLQTYEFDDWDSNGNDVIGEWTWIWDSDRHWWYELDKKDVLDLHPDVYVGRLACRDLFEVKSVVRKIIHYENTAFGSNWLNKMILVGGDTVPYSDGYCEGEIENDLAASYLEPLGFQFTRLWVSNGELSGPEKVIGAIREGACFIYLTGHGTPIEWCTHPMEDPENWIDVYAFEMKYLLNKNKLPICVVGGCHNSQFDVTTLNIIRGIIKHGFKYFLWDEGIDCFGKWTWAPECWSWNLVSQKNGGFIAAIGNTGLGWGVGGSNCVNYLDGFITSHFFQVYADLSQQDYCNLGMIHGETIDDYIVNFLPNEDVLDRKTVEQWVLLGDPSLKIGGYS